MSQQSKQIVHKQSESFKDHQTHLPKSLLVSIKLMLLKRIPGQNNNERNSNNSIISPMKSINANFNNQLTSSISNGVNDGNNNFKLNNKTPQKHNEKESNVKSTNNELKRKDKESSSSHSSSNKSTSKSKNTKSNQSDSYSSTGTTRIKQEKQDNLVPEKLVKSEPTSPTPSTSPSSLNQTPSLNQNASQSQLIPPPPLTSGPAPTPSRSIGTVTPTINLKTPPEISLGQPDDYLADAKKLKHAADKETDRTIQACKYLEAGLFFILTGNAMEQRAPANDSGAIEKVCLMYKETLNLIRQITSKFAKSRSSHCDIPTTDQKLTTLSYRCQSLLYLKLSRLKSKDIRENAKLIQSHQEMNQPPSSGGSNSGSNSITVPTVLFNSMKRQLTLLSQLNTAHDLWQQADHLIEKYPSCKAFFITLDNECGCLTLNSTFDQLVHYVRSGLQILK